MMETIKIGRLSCDFVNTGSARICYILTPIPLDERRITEYAKRYDYTIVVIHGMDWDNDITPWTAPGVLPKDECFRGNANHFLACLLQEVMPEMERMLCIDSSVERTLVGISLSGLFALWARMKCDAFTNIGSISGSFWYDGFADWLSNVTKYPKDGCVYLSLGNKEKKCVTPRYRTIEECTIRVVETLREVGIPATFEMTSGTHFASIYPRLERMFQGFIKLKNESY